jgi:hypothetical protein
MLIGEWVSGCVQGGVADSLRALGGSKVPRSLEPSLLFDIAGDLLLKGLPPTMAMRGTSVVPSS